MMRRRGGEVTVRGARAAVELVGNVEMGVRPPGAGAHDDRPGGRVARASEARARIRTLVSIAAGHGTSVSAQELHDLLPADSFEDAAAVERFVAEDELLNRELQVVRGEVVPRRAVDLVERRSAQRQLTAERMRLAESFVGRLARVCPEPELVAVSGSTAFSGSQPEDDVDFYVVTRPGRTWITLLVAMGLSKLDRLRDPRTPTFCFNRVVEGPGCIASFGRPGDALFAREALSLRVIRGRAFFHRLLEIANWMDGLFPRRYRTDLAESAGAPPSTGRGGWAAWSLANFVAFLGLAPYLWLAGLVRNVRLSRQGRREALFRTAVSLRSFSYESRKFERLREQYARDF